MSRSKGRDLTGKTVVANASSRDPLGYVVRSGVGPGGGWGHWIVDRSGDPGSTQGLAQYQSDSSVKLAVVGETVCPIQPHICPTCDRVHICACPLAHVNGTTLACLPHAEAPAGER